MSLITRSDTLVRVRVRYYAFDRPLSLARLGALLDGVESLLAVCWVPPLMGTIEDFEDPLHAETPEGGNFDAERSARRKRGLGASATVESVSYASPFEWVISVSAATVAAERLVRLVGRWTEMRRGWAEARESIARHHLNEQAIALIRAELNLRGPRPEVVTRSLDRLVESAAAPLVEAERLEVLDP